MHTYIYICSRTMIDNKTMQAITWNSSVSPPSRKKEYTCQGRTLPH